MNGTQPDLSGAFFIFYKKEKWESLVKLRINFDRISCPNYALLNFHFRTFAHRYLLLIIIHPNELRFRRKSYQIFRCQSPF